MRRGYRDITDEQLASRTRRSDESAFEELVLRHQLSVRKWISWIDRRPERTEDLAQETFIKAWTARKSFRGDSKWRTWLMKIALRVCLDKKRRFEPVKVAFTEQTLPDHVLIPETMGAERAVIAKSSLAALSDVINGLSKESRAALVLRYVEEYNSKEIAEIMGKPAGTVRRMLHEARLALKAASASIEDGEKVNRRKS